MPDPGTVLKQRRPIGQCLMIALAFAVLLWWIHLVAFLMDWNLASLGVYPGRWTGLVGLLTSPLIHGSFQHLTSNTLPMVLLGTGLIYGYPNSWKWVVAILWVGSGLGVWLIGRESFHFGASGVATGLMFFLFVAGAVRRDRLSIVLSMLAFFMYGSMVWGIFPTEEGISFEAHFSGAVMGVVCAFLFRNRDPRVPRRKYAWEEDPYHEDPVIGDAWKRTSDTDGSRHTLQ